MARFLLSEVDLLYPIHAIARGCAALTEASAPGYVFHLDTDAGGVVIKHPDGTRDLIPIPHTKRVRFAPEAKKNAG